MDPNLVLYGVAGGLAAVVFRVVLIFLVLRMPTGNQAMRDIERISREYVASIRQVEQAAQDLNTLSTRLARLAVT